MTTAAPPLDAVIEAALLASETPLDLDGLLLLFDAPTQPTHAELQTALHRLSQRLSGTALALHHTASGYRLAIDKLFTPWLSRLWEERPQRYSRALMETLALIAYRQPVTRSDIEEVRGVAVSASIMRTLQDRGWVRVIGQRDVPGRPSVYATTRRFLDDFNLQTLDALPPMHEVEAQFGRRLQQAHDESEGDAAAQRNAVLLDEAAPLSSATTADDRDEASSGSTTTAQDDDLEALIPPPLAGEALDFSTLQARLDARIDAAAQSRDDTARRVSDPVPSSRSQDPSPLDTTKDDDESLSLPHDERSLNDE